MAGMDNANPPRLFLRNVLPTTTTNQVWQSLNEMGLGEGIVHVHCARSRGSGASDPVSFFVTYTTMEQVLQAVQNLHQTWFLSRQAVIAAVAEPRKKAVYPSQHQPARPPLCTTGKAASIKAVPSVAPQTPWRAVAATMPPPPARPSAVDATKKEVEKMEEKKAEQIQEETTVEEKKDEQIEAEKKMEEKKDDQIEVENKMEEKKDEQIEAENKMEEKKDEQIEAENKMEEKKDEQIEEEKKMEEKKDERIDEEKKMEEKKDEQIEAKNKMEEKKDEQIEETTKVEEKKDEQIEEKKKMEEKKDERIDEEKNMEDGEKKTGEDDMVEQDEISDGDVLMTFTASFGDGYQILGEPETEEIQVKQELVEESGWDALQNCVNRDDDSDTEPESMTGGGHPQQNDTRLNEVKNEEGVSTSSAEELSSKDGGGRGERKDDRRRNARRGRSAKTSDRSRSRRKDDRKRSERERSEKKDDRKRRCERKRNERKDDRRRRSEKKGRSRKKDQCSEDSRKEKARRAKASREKKNAKKQKDKPKKKKKDKRTPPRRRSSSTSSSACSSKTSDWPLIHEEMDWENCALECGGDGNFGKRPVKDVRISQGVSGSWRYCLLIGGIVIVTQGYSHSKALPVSQS